MNIKKFYPAVIFLFLIIISACKINKHEKDHEMSSQLFSKTVQLINHYTDSINNTQDSASLKRMKIQFNDKLAKVNFQFPADTDLGLTQEENDCIIHMLDRLVIIINRKDSIISSLPRDTIENESIISL